MPKGVQKISTVAGRPASEELFVWACFFEWQMSTPPVSSFQLYILAHSQDSAFANFKLKISPAMKSFTSRLKQKGFIVSFNPKGDGSCFFSAAAHQLKQDGARLKEATFDYLLSHRFDVSIFIDSNYQGCH